MALSKKDANISTNLSFRELSAVLQAIDRGRYRVAFDGSSGYGRNVEIFSGRKRYQITEYLETIVSLDRVRDNRESWDWKARAKAKAKFKNKSAMAKKCAWLFY